METAEGVYAFACIEGERPWFVAIAPAGHLASRKFQAAVEPGSSIEFASKDGQFDLIFAVRKGFGGWVNPTKTREEMERANNFWRMAS